MKQNDRLLSLDALRGFDMLFIMGFAGLVSAVCALFPGSVSDFVAGTMRHADWDGLTHHDTIFPLFLFIAGVSFPFSLAKQRASGRSNLQIAGRVIRRGITLIFLGMIYNGLLRFDPDTFRVASVLGRIGLAWAVASTIYLYFGRKCTIGVSIGILVGYSLLMTLVAAPDVPGGDPLSYEGNFAGWVDRMLLPGQLLYGGRFDPEGLLTTVPAVVTALLGVLTGDFLFTNRQRLSGNRKALTLFVAAVVLIGLGMAWDQVTPINKNLWSSSFVCVVGGYSLALLALFYYIMDVRGWTRWAFFFKVIGLNSITIYMAQAIINFGGINFFFTGGIASKLPEPWAAVLFGVGDVAVCWLFLYALYRKNIFLKV